MTTQAGAHFGIDRGDLAVRTSIQVAFAFFGRPALVTVHLAYCNYNFDTTSR
jgi:hypothetical protein